MGTKMYKWVAESNDGSFQDESRCAFETKKECYEDMRNAVLEKMKWNTEFDEDFNDVGESEYIGYKVNFTQDCIAHESYSGIYTYRIIEAPSGMKTFDLTEEQVQMIVHALRTNIRTNQESIETLFNMCGQNETTRETAVNLANGNIRIKTLLNYIEQL